MENKKRFDKLDKVLLLVLILELAFLGIVINDKINPPPRIIYNSPINTGFDKCSFVDALDIDYYNKTEDTIYTNSCFSFHEHTYKFYLNNELKYNINNRSAVFKLPFNVTGLEASELNPIEIKVIDSTINKTIGIELFFYKYNT